MYWLDGYPLPLEIAAIVASPGQPVSVYRLDSAYARHHLNDARELIVADADDLDVRLCGFLHTFAVPEDGSGLIVRIEPDVVPADPAAYIADAESVLAAIAGVPVTVQLETALEDTGRNDDRSPWKAGARISDGKGDCSSGYGIVKDSKNYLLTASHCFDEGRDVKSGDGQAIGKVSDLQGYLDTELVSADKVDGKTYIGKVGGNDSAPITEAGKNVVGLKVCV